MLLPTESHERRAMLQGSTAHVTLDKKVLNFIPRFWFWRWGANDSRQMYSMVSQNSPSKQRLAKLPRHINHLINVVQMFVMKGNWLWYTYRKYVIIFFDQKLMQCTKVTCGQKCRSCRRQSGTLWFWQLQHTLKFWEYDSYSIPSQLSCSQYSYKIMQSRFFVVKDLLSNMFLKSRIWKKTRLNFAVF